MPDLEQARMTDLPPRDRGRVLDMKARLEAALGPQLVALVRHGPSTWGDGVDGELNLLIVLADLELATLDRLEDPLAFWRRRGLPAPRLVTRALLAASADVFPLELADLAARGDVLVGDNPARGIAIADEHLRVQCEREMTEKLMRLREAYAAEGRRPRRLRALLAASFPDFCLILRGALRLYGVDGPARGIDAARAFGRAAGLDEASFASVLERVSALRGGRGDADPRALFAAYYAALSRAAQILDDLCAAPEARREGTLP